MRPAATVIVVVVLALGLGAGADPAAAAGCDGTAARSDQVVRLYSAVFDRQPDPGGLAYWNAERDRGRSLATIAAFFVSSPEFRARYGTLDDDGFVRQLYRNVLGRDGDSGGIIHWVGALRAGTLTRSGVVLSFSESPELVGRTGTCSPPAPTPAPVRRDAGCAPIPATTESRVQLGAVLDAANRYSAGPATMDRYRRAALDVMRASGPLPSWVAVQPEFTLWLEVFSGGQAPETLTPSNLVGAMHETVHHLQWYRGCVFTGVEAGVRSDLTRDGLPLGTLRDEVGARADRVGLGDTGWTAAVLDTYTIGDDTMRIQSEDSVMRELNAYTLADLELGGAWADAGFGWDPAANQITVSIYAGLVITYLEENERAGRWPVLRAGTLDEALTEMWPLLVRRYRPHVVSTAACAMAFDGSDIVSRFTNGRVATTRPC